MINLRVYEKTITGRFARFFGHYSVDRKADFGQTVALATMPVKEATRRRRFHGVTQVLTSVRSDTINEPFSTLVFAILFHLPTILVILVFREKKIAKRDSVRSQTSEQRNRKLDRSTFIR